MAEIVEKIDGEVAYLSVEMPDGSWKTLGGAELNELIGKLRLEFGGNPKRPGKGGTRRTDDMHRG